MAPKILVLNYTQQEADLIARETGLKVIRGYVGEGKQVHYVDGYQTDYDYFFPEPYYECAMVFLKLPATEEIAAEFKGKTKILTKDDLNNFRNYWRRNVFVIFVGDTNFSNLVPFGVPFKLVGSSGNDTTPSNCLRQNHDMHEFTQKLTQQVQMPTPRYIVELLKLKDSYDSWDQVYYRFGTRYNPYICNANGDILAAALSQENDDYSGTQPGVIVMGLPKKLTTTTIKIIEFFGEHYEIYTPGEDWKASDSFYPQEELKRLDGEINDITEKALTEVNEHKAKIKVHKEKWNFLTRLVTEQSTSLVDAVYTVLTDVVGVRATKSDAERPTDPIEDLLVEIGDRKILIEVKGTKASNPPLDYPQQAITHIRRRGYGGEVEAGLIVNHDMEKDPLLRKQPYSSTETQRVIADVLYIDTRYLLAIAKDIIDGKLSKADAQNILFGKPGRVVYPVLENSNVT